MEKCENLTGKNWEDKGSLEKNIVNSKHEIGC